MTAKKMIERAKRLQSHDCWHKRTGEYGRVDGFGSFPNYVSFVIRSSEREGQRIEVASDGLTLRRPK